MRRRLLLTSIFLMASGWLALAVPSLACQANISENSTVSGSWFASCTSLNQRGAYAQYYTFTLSQTAIVQIDLESSVDPFLFLLPGNQPTTNWITINDNGGESFNARIVRRLTPGTYTIEATTANSALTGTFKLSVRANGGPDSCRSAFGPNSDADGSWSQECIAVHREGSYARYYTFTLSSTASVQIDLVSNVDSFLYLLPGDSPANDWITLNDNGGENSNARIVRTLVPGTYTIEATTIDPAVTGEFHVSVRANGGGPGCRVTGAPNITRNENWTPACISVHREGSFARYYTFNLTQPASVQIDVVSPFDSFVYLLPGDNPSNNWIALNDNGGGNNNAQIVRTLVPGTYTIEATTAEPSVSGPLTLSLRTNGGGPACRSTLAIGATARASWGTACVSVHRPGSNARYYTFTLAKQTKVQIDLASTAADAFLYLLSGNSPSNNSIAVDDNSGGRGNARLTRTLPPGTYTVEATTRLSGAQGAFTLKVAKLGKNGEIETEEVGF